MMIIDQTEEITVEAGTSAAKPQQIRSIDAARLTLIFQARLANAGTLFVGTKKGGAFMELAAGQLIGRDIFSPNNAFYIYGTAGDKLYISEGYANR